MNRLTSSGRREVIHVARPSLVDLGLYACNGVTSQVFVDAVMCRPLIIGRRFDGRLELIFPYRRGADASGARGNNCSGQNGPHCPRRQRGSFCSSIRHHSCYGCISTHSSGNSCCYSNRCLRIRCNSNISSSSNNSCCMQLQFQQQQHPLQQAPLPQHPLLQLVATI